MKSGIHEHCKQAEVCILQFLSGLSDLFSHSLIFSLTSSSVASCAPMNEPRTFRISVIILMAGNSALACSPVKVLQATTSLWHQGSIQVGPFSFSPFHQSRKLLSFHRYHYLDKGSSLILLCYHVLMVFIVLTE